jgi:hypothetical protein
MKARICWSAAIMAVAAIGFALQSMAQQAAPSSSTAASSSPPPAERRDVQLSGPVQITHEELRFQFSPHVFGVNDVLQEIYIKLDCYTGKTWRFHASTAQWTPIPEPTSGPSLDASEENRYQLLTHDYYDTHGEEHELILRVDGVTGNSWTYRGANGTWKEVATVE